jgi:flagellar biosynthetic protein FliR
VFPSFQFSENEILAFALVLIRVSAFVVSWPVFSVYSVPNQAKILLALILSVLMFPVIEQAGLQAHGHANKFSDEIIWLAAKEAMVGLCMGFVTRSFFFAMSIGGNLTSTYLGLASGQMFNPTLGTQSTTIEQFYLCSATLIFLALNGHHVFLKGLADSFTLVPLSMDGIHLGVFKETTVFVKDVVVAGIQISAPIMVSIFLLNILMGILGRTVPQINVLVTSMPVNVMAGLFVMILTIPVLTPESEGLMRLMADHLFKFLKAL